MYRLNRRDFCTDKLLVRYSQFYMELIYIIVDIFDRQLRRRNAITNFINRVSIASFKKLRIFVRLIERPANFLKGFTRNYLTMLNKITTVSAGAEKLNYIKLLFQLGTIIFSLLVIVFILFIA